MDAAADDDEAELQASEQVMISIRRRRPFFSASMLAMALTLGAGPAEAQNLFDILFGGGIKQQRRGEFPRPPAAPGGQAQPRPQKPIAKISAPSYYTYRADALVKVDFEPIVEARRAAYLVPTAEENDFAVGLAGLEGFELLAEKDVAAALRAYYAKHPRFIWGAGGQANERAHEAIRVLSEADSHGLDAADYVVAMPGGDDPAGDMPARLRRLVRFEMTLSARALRYARDAWGGRIDANRLSGYHDFPRKPLDLAEVLGRLARLEDPRGYLESLHPRDEAYTALRVELETLRASVENDIVVDPKLLLRPGGRSDELPKILTLIERKSDEAFRREHEAVLELHQASQVYEADLVPLIKAAQEAHGLRPDGIIGPRTVAVLAGHSRADRIAKVEVALEQMRWHPHELGSPRVFINQPAFSAAFIEDGAEKISMRVVIGKTSNQTSFFFDEIEQVDYNPYWGVPQSIIVNEMLPRLRKDPGYLDRAGYEVTDSKGRRVPSSAINWGQYGGRVPYSVRQTPSEANALGELKILFPNKHAIYMHDTPQKALFDRDSRAFSHGCIRLHDPRGMAAAVLGTSRDHVAAKISQGHSSEKVARKVPVYVAYFTAWPTMDGTVEYFSDVYGRDERVIKAIEATSEARAASS